MLSGFVQSPVAPAVRRLRLDEISPTPGRPPGVNRAGAVGTTEHLFAEVLPPQPGGAKCDDDEQSRQHAIDVLNDLVHYIRAKGRFELREPEPRGVWRLRCRFRSPNQLSTGRLRPSRRP